MPQALTGEQIDQIVRLRAAGLTQTLIAAEVGVSQGSVSHHLQIRREMAGDDDADDERSGRRRRIAPIDVSASVGESRRVIEYVNRQICRWNNGDRAEPVDVIVYVAQNRRNGRA